MAISVIFINRIVTVDGAGTTTLPNWSTTDTQIRNAGASAHLPYREYMSGAPPTGLMRIFAVSNVATDYTVAYFERGIYLVRVATAGQSVSMRCALSTLIPGRGGQDYATDASNADTDPTTTTGLTTLDGNAVYGQPVTNVHYKVRETEGPRRLFIGQYTRIGIVASALNTSLEVEIRG